MLVDYPGVYLMAMFTPFVFGPVTQKTKCCQCCCSGGCCSSCGNMKMHLSFRNTYLNLLLMGIGYVIIISNFFRMIGIPIYIGGKVIPLYVIIGIFHLLETKNACCSNFCLPFTKREEYGTEQSQEETADLEMHKIV